LLGTTPLDGVAVPRFGASMSFRLRVERQGYEPAELLPNVFADLRSLGGPAPLDTVRLDRVGEAPGMVRIPGFTTRDTIHRGVTLRFADYHIGRNEVTNREYQRFVDAGGYVKREYWLEPFVKDGRALTWEQGMAALHDRTGMPGPSTWSGGHYPAGQENYPVGGVSYYEAAAYARFAGVRLPTSAHWLRAALRSDREVGWVYRQSSNIGGARPRPVGQGVPSALGLYDVAGNVREWCVNPIDSGRSTRGASWEDPDFTIGHLIPKPEFDRAPSNGFRVMAVTDADSTIEHLAGRLVRVQPRDFRAVRPVSDAEFAIYRRTYDYDARPLEARRDSGGTVEQFRWERVSFTAAYGGERMAAYLFLPLHARPPYEPVILWPSSNEMTDHAFDPGFFQRFVAYVPQSGRMLVMPVFKGAYDRDDSTFSTVRTAPDSTTYYRDLAVQWMKDMRRTVDYLETRDDVRADRIGFLGISWGGEAAAVALAVEPRIKAAVLQTGGYVPGGGVPRPEVDAVNFVPRIHAPTLMLNGRYDVIFPYATSQVPFFEQLGTPARDKEHRVFASSHSVPQDSARLAVLAWFDRYLSGAGPNATSASPPSAAAPTRSPR
jgi:dienelactone hydrolase